MAKKSKNTPLDHETTDDQQRLAEKIQNRLESSVSYNTAQGLFEEWAEYQRFWDADQWTGSKAGTESFPRPVTNHFGEIIEMKVAGLTYERAEMYYEPKKGYMENDFKVEAKPLVQDEEAFEVTPAEILAAAVDNIWEFNDMDQQIESFCRSGGLLGDGILYSFFNNDVKGGGEGGFIGEIEVMEIDVTDFYVGDPTQPDLQKQPFVMITERMPLAMARKEYDEHTGMSAHLQSEESESNTGYDHEQIEPTETDYVNLVHYWEKVVDEEDDEVEGVEITRRHDGVNYYVVCQDFVLREEQDFYRSKKYPFSNFKWYPRRKSFYSKSESRDLINNQKELNRLQGIALLGAYKTGLPNIRYKENFVKKEDLSTGPGGNIIPDETPPGQGWGVDYLQPPTIASYIPLLKDAMAQGMKDTSGVHEAWSGKAPSAHLNASAIMALQEAAGVRIRGIQRRLYSAIRDLGEIWLGYMMQYYNEDRLYKVFGKNNVEGLAWMRMSEFEKMEFDCKVTMSSASPYSKTVIASTLESMVEKGIIDGDMYLRMLPPEVFPKVTELLALLEDRVIEQQEMVMQQQKQVIDEVVVQTIEKAREAGVQISPEVLQEMMTMVQQTAEKQEI